MLSLNNQFAVRVAVPLIFISLALVWNTAADAQDAANVAVTINCKNIVRKVPATLIGLNTAAWDSEIGSQTEDDLLQKTAISSLRYPGGSWSDDFNWTRSKYAGMPSTKVFDTALESLGACGVVTLNYGSGSPQMAAAWVAYNNAKSGSTAVIGVDSAGFNWRTAGYWANLRAAAPLPVDDGLNILRANHPSPFNIQDYEVGNECYGSWENDKNVPAHDPVLYAQFFARTKALIMKIAPSVRVGAVITGQEDSDGDGQETVVNPVTGKTHSGWTAVVLSTLRGLKIAPDFVIYHYYPEQPGQENDSKLLQSAGDWATAARSIRVMLNNYLPEQSSRIDLYATENNDVTFNPGKQSTSLVDGLYLADSFGQIAQTEFKGFYWWCLHNSTSPGNNESPALYGWRNYGDYGILSSGQAEPHTPLDSPYPPYRAFELLRHFCAPGDSIVSATTDNPLVSAYAALRKDRKLALLLINKNPTSSANIQLSITGFSNSAMAGEWTYGIQEDKAPLQDQPSELTYSDLTKNSTPLTVTAGPYSMNVVVFSARRE